MFTFFKPSPKKLRHDLLLDAELSLLTHRQLAEYHEAMFTMLSGRVSSLRAEIAAQQEVDREAARYQVPSGPVREKIVHVALNQKAA